MKQFLADVALAGVLGYSVYISLRPHNVDNNMLNMYARIKQSPIASHILQIKELSEMENIRHFLNTLENFLEMAVSEKVTLFVLNRLCHEACAQALNICNGAKLSKNSDTIAAAIHFETDCLPLIKAHCEVLLKNAMLDNLNSYVK
jgi:hypothetical protein